MTSEKIADKIRKLLAHADGTSNPEEAEIYMAKVHAMLQANGLSMVDLGTINDEDPVSHVRTDRHNTAHSPWRRRVANMLAQYYGCKLVVDYQTKENVDLVIFGRQSAILTFELMWPYVARRVLELARREHSLGHYTAAGVARNKIGNALSSRIWAMICERKAEEERAATPVNMGTGSNALVPVDMLDAAAAELLGGLTQNKAKPIKIDMNARAVAREVSLNAQATGRAAQKRIQ